MIELFQGGWVSLPMERMPAIDEVTMLSILKSLPRSAKQARMKLRQRLRSLRRRLEAEGERL